MVKKRRFMDVKFRTSVVRAYFDFLGQMAEINQNSKFMLIRFNMLESQNLAENQIEIKPYRGSFFTPLKRTTAYEASKIG